MHAEAETPRRPSEHSKSVYRARLVLKHGLRLAEEAGRVRPSLRDAVWELLLEAADTLKRLPNRERGWLTARSRSHWPEFARNLDDAFDGAAGQGARATPLRLRPAAASAEAIDRMDVVLLWLSHVGGTKPQRDLAVLFGLASGIRVASLRSRFGCGRRTVYDIRDRALGRLCTWLSAEIDADDLR